MDIWVTVDVYVHGTAYPFSSYSPFLFRRPQVVENTLIFSLQHLS